MVGGEGGHDGPAYFWRGLGWGGFSWCKGCGVGQGQRPTEVGDLQPTPTNGTLHGGGSVTGQSLDLVFSGKERKLRHRKCKS